MSRSLPRAAGMMSLAISFSRLTGLLREMTMAALFTSRETDAWTGAFRIPNMLRELLAEGSLNAAFVPIYTAVKERAGRQAAFRLASAVLSVLVVITGLFGLAIVLFSRPFMFSISSGFSPDKLEMAARLAQVVSPFLLFLSTAAVLMGMANVEGRFFVPAAASAAFNLTMVGAAFALSPLCVAWGLPAITSMAIGSVLGGMVQLAVQVPGVWRDGFRFTPTFDRCHGELLRVTLRMGPAVVGVAATYVATLVDTQVASYYGDGPTTWMQYAFRLWLLPVGLFGVAISTVNLAGVSKDAALGDMNAFKRTLGASTRMTLMLNVPAAVGLAVLSGEISRVVYQHGKLAPEGAKAVGELLAWYAIGLPAYALIKLYVPTLYALGRSWIPVLVSLTVISLKAVTNLALFHAGYSFQMLALTTGIAACLNALVTGWLLRKQIGGLGEEGVARCSVIVLLASTAMAAACSGVGYGLRIVIPGAQWGLSVLRLAIEIGVGVAVLLAVLSLFRVEELQRLSSLRERIASRFVGPR